MLAVSKRTSRLFHQADPLVPSLHQNAERQLHEVVPRNRWVHEARAREYTTALGQLSSSFQQTPQDRLEKVRRLLNLYPIK